MMPELMELPPYAQEIARNSGRPKRWLKKEWIRCYVAYGHEPGPVQWREWIMADD